MGGVGGDIDGWEFDGGDRAAEGEAKLEFRPAEVGVDDAVVDGEPGAAGWETGEVAYENLQVRGNVQVMEGW